MSEWIEYKISEIADIIGGGTPKTSIKEYWNGDIPWLSVVDFNTGKKYVSKTEKTITNLGLEKSSTKLLKANDIIISARGTIGALAMLDKPMTFNQSCYGMRAKENTSISDYLFYLLKDTVKQLQQASYGAVFDTITRNTFDETTILLPPLKEQKAIAEVLSSLDDKIDLLHRQNKTLEELAQTLFRQWFIEEADEGWETCKLSDIAVMQNGFSFSSKHYVPYEQGHLEVLKMGHIERGGGLKLNPKKDFVPREEKLEKWILNKNDIVLAMTDMKDNVVILGVPAIIDKSDKYVLNQRVARIYLKSNDKLLNNYLLYVQLKDPDFIALLQSKANSGVQVNLSTQAIKDSEIIIPPMSIQETVGKDITNLYLKKENNDIQIKTLENMRDTLLPKLMSGEVRLKIMKSLFQEIRDLNNWDYYNREPKCEISDWNDNSKHQEFIKNFLKISRKELVANHFFNRELRDAGVSLDSFERATHTNSVFFIGCLLYEKLSFKDKINFVREDGKGDEFHFIWFLTSLIHDFGYFAERDKTKFSHVTEDISSLRLTHNLLNYDTDTGCLKEAYTGHKDATKLIINEIPNYFKEAFNGNKSSRGTSKIEHGIYAGLLLYDGLVKNRMERKAQQSNGVEEGLYWKDDLDKFYAIASFSIAIHNMRRDGIVENSEDLKFSIDDEPFLFLFALADTIEPIKTFGNENPEDILKNILIDIQEDKIILQNASSSRLDFSKLANKVCDLASWLDVNVCREGSKLTIEINNKSKA